MELLRVGFMLKMFAKALKKNSDICGCYITSPTYYGEISDIVGISKVCKEYNIPLLVMVAHGSHLKFLSEDIHPITLGASMTACSVHKTLPVLTVEALLNINDDRFIEGSKEAMSLFASTSPPYPDNGINRPLCRLYFLKNADIYKRLEPIIAEIKILADRLGILQPDGLCDPLRIARILHLSEFQEKKHENFSEVWALNLNLLIRKCCIYMYSV